jgi:hypothetical protein
LHAQPRLGSVQLRRIDAGMLNGLYAELLADGKQSNGGGGLSPRSVRYVHTIVTEHCGMRCAGAGSLATLPTPRTRLEPRQPRGRR